MPLARKLRKLSTILGIHPGALARLSFTPEQRYERFIIPKRGGKYREIMQPAPDLMMVQKLIKRAVLDSSATPPECVTAFVPGRSIVDNARIHSDKAVVVKFDLQDFFPSISLTRVFCVFRSLGFNEIESRSMAFIVTSPVNPSMATSKQRWTNRRSNERSDLIKRTLSDAIETVKEAAHAFYRIAEGWQDGSFEDPGDCRWDAETYSGAAKDYEKVLKGVRSGYPPAPECRRRTRWGDVRGAWRRGLPQGAPTSPQLANLVCRRLDQRLAGLARAMDFQFTRYADDLAFSSDDPMAKVDRLAAAVNEIVRDCGFELNDRKTVVMRSPASRRVTGLTVSGPKPRVPRATMRKIRAMIHQSERDPNFANAEQLKGFLSFVSMVNPEQLAQLTGGLNPSKTGTKTNKAMTRTADSKAKKKQKGEVPKTSARSKAKKTS